MFASPLARITLVAALVTATAFGTVAAARAATLDENEKIVPVTFTAKELATPEKAEKAYARLYRAVQSACDTEQPGPSWRLADDKLCEDEAMQGALRDINNTTLSKLYAETNGAPELAAVFHSRDH